MLNNNIKENKGSKLPVFAGLAISAVAVYYLGSSDTAQAPLAGTMLADEVVDRCMINEFNNWSTCLDDSYCQGDRVCTIHPGQRRGFCEGKSACG